MKRLLFLVTLLLPSLAFAQGVLTPPPGAFLSGAPTSTMKSLDQLEARTPLAQPAGSTTGLTLSAPGSYYLMGNVTVASGDAITIAASKVTLDLNGFTISSTASASTGTAIYLPSAQQNITIRNGHISSPITVNASTGAITGTGFQNGIYCSSILSNAIVSDLTVSGCRDSGIYLDKGSTVEHCVVTDCGRYGIAAQVVSDCSAQNCNDTAISGTTIANCQGFSNSNVGISGTSVTNCTGSALADRVAISATTAIGCTAQSGTISANQIDGRAVIGALGGSSTPVTINASGSYVLLGKIDLGSTGGTAITIAADNVTLDLNGFTISTTASASTGTAIYLPSSQENITIRNGHISSPITVNASTGAITGTGFHYGIACGGSLSNTIVSDLTISGCSGSGIFIDSGSTVERCIVTNCGVYGIQAQVVSDCSAQNCYSAAIIGTTIVNSQGSSIREYGIIGTNVTNCMGASVAATGSYAGISAKTATGCTGTSTAGPGINAGTATNCHGKSDHGTRGLNATNTATGCTGEITTATCPANATIADYPRGLSAGSAENCTGTIITANGSCFGLFATTATNCTGIITEGSDSAYATAGLYAETATGCRGECPHSPGLGAIVATNSCGYSTNSYGLAAGTATNCYGSSINYTGLRATGTANSCRGKTGGTGLVYAIDTAIAVACTTEAGTIKATNKYNMP